MVTVTQFTRGVSRTLRAIERDARRAERRRLLLEKAKAKQAVLDASAAATDEYEHLIEVLTAAHRITFERKNWKQLAKTPLPHDPVRGDSRERAATAALATYTPSWFARTLGFARRKTARLAASVEKARADDNDSYQQELANTAAKRDEIKFAQSLVTLQPQAILTAIKDHASLKEIAIDAVSILLSKGRVIAVVDGLELEDMPTESVTLLQSGKASMKPISAAKRVELHRDNIYSSAIRVAAECLRVVPIDSVEIVARTDLLDHATGHITPQPVLYGRITAQALGAVNLTRADPAPLAERLGVVSNWNRKVGFLPLDLTPFDLPLDRDAQHAEAARS